MYVHSTNDVVLSTCGVEAEQFSDIMDNTRCFL